MENSEQRGIAGNRVESLFAMLLITITASASIYIYLRHNPGHLLVFDDSYITLQFASNFFKYGSITYDGSSFFEGATSPFHIIFIAICSLFLKIETASLAAGSIFFIASSFLSYLWTLALYNNKVIALLAGILMATSGWLVFDALNGLETTTFIFFSLLTFYLYYVYECKPYYAIPLFLSILTRPEGWFIAGALWMWQIIKYLIHRDNQTLKTLFTSLAAIALLITPYFLLVFYYTESFLPGTALAKAIFFNEGSMPFINKVGFFKNRLLPFFITVIFPIPLLMFPLMLCARRVLFLPYLWFYFISFYLFYFFLFPGAIQHYWYRYQHIFLPLMIIALAGGTYELINVCKQRSLKIAMAAVVCLCLTYNQFVSFRFAKNIYRNQIACTEETLLDLTGWIKANTPEDSSIALHDIGFVGYNSKREIVDLVGLTNPEIRKQYVSKSGRGALPFTERKIIDYLREKKPDYLVIFPEWDRFFNLLQPANIQHFDLKYTTSPLYPSELRYNVYKCNWNFCL
jgi:hypothetical protein